MQGLSIEIGKTVRREKDEGRVNAMIQVGGGRERTISGFENALLGWRNKDPPSPYFVVFEGMLACSGGERMIET